MRIDQKPVLLAIVAVVLAIAVRALLDPLLGGSAPFVVFILAVLASSLRGGVTAGLVANALGAAAAWILFVRPTFTIHKGSTEELVRLLMFSATGVAIAILSGRIARSQREARQSESRFRATFENAAVGMAHVGLGGQWLEVNQRLCDLLGYSREQLLKLTFADVTHPDDLEADWAQARAVQQGTGDHYSMEKRYLRRDGSVVWANLTVSVQRDAAGAPQYFISVIEDISDRKQAEAALRDSEARFRGLFQLAAVGMAISNLEDGRFLAANQKMCEITGYSVDELLQLTFFDITHPDDREANRRLFQSLFTGRQTAHTFEKRYVRSDGAVVWVQTTVSLVRDANGVPYQSIGIIEDITERRAARHGLERANEQLEQFAFAAAHDLQEPLRNVTLYSELLTRRLSGQLDSETRELFGHVTAAARRMMSLIKDLLSYTQAVATDAHPGAVDSRAAALQAVQGLSPAINETGARIEIGALPSVQVFEPHMVQVFQNLIGNALKYRCPDRVPVVVVTAVQDGPEWKFRVCDNGIGIAPEYHDRIFGVFKRLHNRSVEGTGIGLAIVKRIVEHYGGRIWVESAEGSGAAFCFTMPVAQLASSSVNSSK